MPALEDAYSGGSLPGHPDSLNIHKRDLEGGQMARDMNLFVDDDGKAYHIYSSEEKQHIAYLPVDRRLYQLLRYICPLFPRTFHGSTGDVQNVTEN